MRGLSIRAKITLWFSAALILVVAISFFVVLYVSKQVIQKTIRDNLIETVEHNVDEVEYYDGIDDVDLVNEVDHYIEYKDGFLEIDDDFLDEVNQVYTSLYHSEGAMLYGENPIAKQTSEMSFKDSQIQRTSVNGTLYYIFDRKLTAKGLNGLWMRGVVAETQGTMQIASISRTSLILMPILVIIAIIGGYLIAGHMLKPIRQIACSAANIREGGDLKARIELGKGKDEVHQLANNFNQMFARLDKAFQTERQFTFDASHELRTPMSVIMAQCEFSLEKERSAEEYKEALTVINRQGKKMSRLISDMLDFTRLEVNCNQYIKEQVNLSEITKGLCFDMKLIKENGITLEYEVEENLLCSGNKELITRLLTNLISNAYRYGKENGNIFVSLKSEASTIELSVSDNGIGVKKEEQEKIFDRFYQADNSRSGIGTGLGLAMVREIADFHGWDIKVESEPGVGSVFTVIIPKSEKNK